jgi:hypothetical protein
MAVDPELQVALDCEILVARRDLLVEAPCRADRLPRRCERVPAGSLHPAHAEKRQDELKLAPLACPRKCRVKGRQIPNERFVMDRIPKLCASTPTGDAPSSTW